MRNLLIFLILAVCSGCRPEQAALKGHIVGYHGEVVRVCPEGQVERRDTLRVDSLGNFVCTLAGGGVYEISVKDHMPWIPVYVGTGDRVEIALTLTKDKRVTVLFAGGRMAENAYLAAYNEARSRRFWNDPKMAGISFNAFHSEIDAMRSGLQQLLDKVKDAGVREKLAVKQHLMLQEHLLRYNWLTGDRENPDADYEAFVTSIDLNDPAEANESILGSVISWYQSKEPFDRARNYMIDYLEILAHKVTNQSVVDEHATMRVMSQFQHFSGNLDDLMEVYNRICRNDSLRQATNDEYREYERAFGNLMPGKVAPDFELIDPDGKKCRLSDLRGKYLFIDIWATWCAPCREEIPHMAVLQKHFAKDKRIALISISVDSNRDVWKKFLEKDKPAWAQYNVDKKNNEFLDKEYRIFGIPHFMLIDPEGRFVSYSFTRPSDSECAKLIENSMNQKTKRK